MFICATIRPKSKLKEPAMSQSDFASLAVQCGVSDASLDTCVAEVLSVTTSNFDMWYAKYEDMPLMGMYSTSAAYEQSTLTTESPSDGMDLDAAPVPQDIYEPARRLNDFVPPKRFFRTFWRSAARRILAMSSSRMMV